METIHTIVSLGLMANLVAHNRQYVKSSFNAAKTKNDRNYVKRLDIRATSEYIYENQIEDAEAICNMFYLNKNLRAVSINKRTKVGMNGLMIYIMNFMCSIHPDDEFIIDPDNVIIATGMSNVAWEDDLKDSVPECFKNNIYHHGKLKKLPAKLKELKNGLIIIDEIDTGDKVGQRLHKILNDAGILDFEHMERNNIRLIFVSATMSDQLSELNKWGDYHKNYKMTVPSSYIGHGDFLSLGIFDEFYPVIDDDSAERWVKNDIIDRYGNDYRVSIIRTDLDNIKFIEKACIKNNIKFGNFSRDKNDKITAAEVEKIFESNLDQHIVLAIKGFYRRANLIPNKWKLKIGATHERFVDNPNASVQVQGLPGRMSGYWRTEIENGHLTGPHRTSIAAIKEYEEWYNDPVSYVNKKKEKETFVAAKNFKNNEKCNIKEKEVKKIPNIVKCKTQEEIKEFFDKNLKPINPSSRGPTIWKDTKKNAAGFFEATVREIKKVYSYDEIKKEDKWGLNKTKFTFRYQPCYDNINDPSTLHWCLIYY